MTTETCQHEWTVRPTEGPTWYDCRKCGKVAEAVTHVMTQIKYSRDHLEAFVDTVGLSMILSDLADIASDKADHIRSAWQDEPLAKTWDRASALLDRASLVPFVQDMSGHDHVESAVRPTNPVKRA